MPSSICGMENPLKLRRWPGRSCGSPPKIRQHRPQRQRNRQERKRNRILAMCIVIKIERAIQQHGAQTNIQRQVCIGCARGGKPAHRRRQPQIPPGKPQSRNPNQHVIPSQDEFLPPHQPRRDEDAQRHRHQQHRAQERNERRGLVVRYPRLQPIMQSVGGPTQLPGAEILVPALLVKVGEQQEQQQRHERRQDDSVGGESTLHIFGNSSPPLPSIISNQKSAHHVFIPS